MTTNCSTNWNIFKLKLWLLSTICFRMVSNECHKDHCLKFQLNRSIFKIWPPTPLWPLNDRRIYSKSILRLRMSKDHFSHLSPIGACFMNLTFDPLCDPLMTSNEIQYILKMKNVIRIIVLKIIMGRMSDAYF